MDLKTVEDYVLSMPESRKEYPFGEGTAVYKYKDEMFALIDETREPIRISLKCDPQLAKLLRENYETVMEGHKLNKKYWNTVVLTGQLPWEEVQGLVRHSFDLIAGEGKSVGATVD